MNGTRDRFSRIVSVAMVLVTLAAALVGYLLNDASKSNDQAAARAQRLSLQAMGSVFRGQQRAQVAVETFVAAEQQRLRAADVRRRRLFAEAGDAAALELEERRWRRLAERTQRLTPLAVEGTYGPERDPVFPYRWYVAHQQDATRLGGIQDAANAESSIWGSRFASYTAILTMFAVALYLLGFSLTLPRTARRLFFTMGIALSVAGSAWAATLAAAAPERAPDAAAEAYAQGEVAYQAAYLPPDYREAVRHFDRAIELRPSFAQAYVARADAEFEAGAPPSGLFPSFTSARSLERATADLKRAIALGAANGRVLGNLGFYEFVLAVRERRPELLDDAERHLRRSVRLSPAFVEFAYTLGVVLLAEGRRDDARAGYELAIRRTIYRDAARETLRNDEQFEEELVAGALTDLETLAGAEPGLRDEVRATKELVVGSVSRRRLAPPASRATFGDPVGDVFAGEVQVSGMRIGGLDFERDTISMQWYAAAPGGAGWSVLPEVSGIVFAEKDGYGPGELQLDDDGYFVLRSYLASTYPPRCFERGRYRVELYVNGRLVSTTMVETTFSRLLAGVARTLDVHLCRPPAWERSDLSLEGLMEGFVSPDRSRGVYAFRLGTPRSLAGLPPERVSPAVLRQLVRRFAFVFPAEPRFTEPDESPYFLGLDGAVTYHYAYAGGRVLAGAGVADDGTVVAGLVFAPSKDWDGDLPVDVFDSMVLVE